MPYFIFASHRHSLLRPLSLLPALGLCLGLVLAGAFWCPPAAQAASINIEGGGGGGGGGDDGSGAAARGGGGNGGLINTAAGVTAGTGESDNTSPGGNGGQGGNANANKDGADGGVGGAGLNTLVTNHGVTAGVTQTGEDGGNGGSAAADVQVQPGNAVALHSRSQIEQGKGLIGQTKIQHAADLAVWLRGIPEQIGGMPDVVGPQGLLRGE